MRRSGSIPNLLASSLAAAKRITPSTSTTAPLQTITRRSPKYAIAFDKSGWAYYYKQDYDRAIADYTEAIRLDPKYAISFDNRGQAYYAKQDYDRAIADYNEAIRLDAKNALAFSHRCRAYAAQQVYDRAITDCNEAIRLHPKSPCAALWLYLARTRSGAQTAAAELETNAKNLKQPDWPFPVVELFLGRQTPETTLAAATKSDEQCQAQFYVGEWHLLQGDRPAGKKVLQAAVDSCPKTLMEYTVARAELQQLHSRP
jgi:lipoprotein NlpI